jgi:hypothetical protein
MSFNMFVLIVLLKIAIWLLTDEKIHTTSFSQMKLNFTVQKRSFQLKLFPLCIWAQFSLALFGSFGPQLVKVRGDKSETHSHIPFTSRAPIHRWAPEFLAKIQNQIHDLYKVCEKKYIDAYSTILFKRTTRRVPPVAQGPLTLPENLSSFRFLVGFVLLDL